MTPEQKRILARGLKGAGLFGTGGAVIGGTQGAILGTLIGGAMGASKELIKSNKEKKESKLKRLDKFIINSKKTLEKKIRKKTKNIKYLGAGIGHIFDADAEFDRRYPKTSKVITYGIINPLVPIPFGSIGGIAGKAGIGGTHLIYSHITKKKK